MNHKLSEFRARLSRSGTTLTAGSRLLRTPLLLTVVTFLAILLPRSGDATVLQFLEMEELTEISDLIVLGKVTAVESGWEEGRSRIRTRVTLEVQRVLLGTVDHGELNIELPGGFLREENLRQVIPGVPRFAVGEEAVVFLRNDPGLFCPVAGWLQGKFRVIVKHATGRKMVVDRFGKCRRYTERKAGIAKPKTLGAAQEVGVEEFAAVIAEIQGKKGSGR